MVFINARQPLYRLNPIYIIYADLYSKISKFLWMSIKKYENTLWRHSDVAK